MGDTQNDCEKLFLLEVLVDSLLISNSSINLDKDLLASLTDTCVLFQFLHYPPLVVCESDFIGTLVGRQDNSHVTFKSGKSCFFSLRTPRGPILPVPFEVKVTVLRRLKEGVLPDKLEVGKTVIKMSDEFTELLRTNTDANCDSLPLSKSKRGVFEIQDGFGKNVGSVTAFLRVSCFGKLIITQFSLNKEDEKSYLFKGMDMKQDCPENNQRFPCGDEGKPAQIPCQPAAQQALPTREVRLIEDRGYGQDRAQREREERRYSRTPANRWENEYDARNLCPDSRPCGCPTDYSYRPPAPPPSLQSSGRRTGRGPLCECPYPVPASVMSKYNNQQRAGKNLDLTPGEVGLDDDRVVFQLPLKKQGEPLTERNKQIDSSVYYKLTSSEETKDGQQKNTVHIKSDDLPGMASKGAVGPVSGLPVDDRHDVFLLKIGKKCDGDKKRNLELELRTPKMKEPKPPTTDQDTQYLESDIPKPEGEVKGKGKGKGKGKKGSVGKGKGKGKKGKKK